MSVRIAKYIADCGITSRRSAEDMIVNGRVAVNGAIINTPVYFVEDKDNVTVDGKPISQQNELTLKRGKTTVNLTNNPR